MTQNSQPGGVGLPGLMQAEPAPQFQDLPKEIGVLLLALGTLGLILPGPIGTPALIAGGVVLWPGTFGRISSWMEKRYPRFTREGNRHINRYLADMERRYPSTGH